MLPPSLVPAPAIALPDPARSNRNFASLPIWCAIALAGWLVLRVFLARIGHDESQYVAGADLALRYTIFRDYLSLQPPLQSWVYAPLAFLFPDDVFLSMRLLTALLGLATIIVVYLTLRSIGVNQRNALLSAGSMAAVDAFQNASSVVRNDMLPALFLSIALWAALKAIQKAQLRLWFLTGIALGLAASTKLSYVPFCVAAGGFTIWPRDNPRWRAVAYTAGLGIGTVPALWAWADAPGSFLWGVLTYGATAPFEWYRGIGEGWELSPFDKGEDIIGYLLLGPAMLALVYVGARLRALLPTDRARETMFLGLMIVAGLIGTLLPTPSHSQYIVPLLPPLFVALGIVLPRESSGVSNLAKALGAFAVIGVAPSVPLAYRTAHSGSPILIADADAAWMRRHLPAAHTGDEIATFSPERAVDTGMPIDDDFATGPFVFRSGSLLNPRMAAGLHVAVPSNLEQVLDKRLPVAVLTGYESPPEYPGCLDAYLDAYARRHGYRLLRLPDGTGRLYVRPKTPPTFNGAVSDLPIVCKHGGVTASSTIPATS